MKPLLYGPDGEIVSQLDPETRRIYRRDDLDVREPWSPVIVQSSAWDDLLHKTRYPAGLYLPPRAFLIVPDLPRVVGMEDVRTIQKRAIFNALNPPHWTALMTPQEKFQFRLRCYYDSVLRS